MPGSNNNDNKYTHEQLDPKTLEQLNAYLDGELSEAEQAAVGDLLRRSPAAANEMATLKATSKVLNELPPMPALRSFAVRPAMLEQPAQQRRSFTLFGWTPSPSFALSLGSVAAACLLVLVLVAQLASSGGSKNAAQTTSSAQNGSTGQAYSNPRTNNAPSSGGGSAAPPAPTQPPAPMALAATPTSEETTMSAAIAQPTPTAGNSATGGASTAPSGAPTPANPPTGFTQLNPPQPTAPGGGPDAIGGAGSVGNNPATPRYNGNAPGLITSPTTAAPSNQANNPATSGGSISTSGGIPDQNTNQTNNYNVLQGKSIDYWLVIEIALAVLAVVLGLGALIAQRRNR